MKQVLRFLHALSLHNDKVWFDAHKADYLWAKGTVDELVLRLIAGIRSFDDTIGPLSPADCTYRIYRDVRFSKDKSPYKTHMGIYVNRGGKKKKVPKGFPADSPDADFFRLKNFCLLQRLDDSFVLAPDLAERVLAAFRSGKPFLDYVNRAIDFCREEKQEYFTSLDF